MEGLGVNREHRLQNIEALLRPRREQIIHLYIDDGDPDPPKGWTSETAAMPDAKGRTIVMHHPVRDT